MNYNEIIDTALKYSMRTDQQTADMMDTFLRIVEARIDRQLNTLDMSNRATLDLDEDQQYYGLPTGFLALRDIQIQDLESPSSQVTPVYVAPEMMNNAISNNETRVIYTIIAQQIQIYPVCEGQQVEIVYSRKIPPLTSSDQKNWVSVDSPDAYIFGLLVEISSFAKDNEAGQLWEARFKGTLSSMQLDDDISRWSGPQLRIQLG